MYRIKSKTLIQSSIIIGLITSINLHADSGLDKALNKHQKTFEKVMKEATKQKSPNGVASDLAGPEPTPQFRRAQS